MTGNPNAVVLDDSDVEVYYHETGGNMVDRYWSSVNGWASTNITPAGTSSSDLWGIRRATSPNPNLEVHYWKGSTLEDTNWSFGHLWTTLPVPNTP